MGFWANLFGGRTSGDTTPNRADITMTQQIVDIAKPLGVLVHHTSLSARTGMRA